MRLDPTALARAVRKALTATTAAVVAGGVTVLTAGSASAAATVTADSCTGTVGGRAGDTVAVDGSAVSDLVRQGAEEAKSIIVVHDLTIWPNHLADTIADERLSVGTVPDARTGSVDGATIGAAVREALDGSAGLGALPSTQDTTLDTIEEKVAGDCGLAVETTDHTTDTTTRSDSGGTSNPDAGDSGGAPSSAPDDTGGTATGEGAAMDTGTADGGLQGTGDARSPRRDYGDIPVAEAPSAGIAVPPDLRYAPSNGVPGDATTPEFDILGPGGDESGQGSGERSAGEHSTGVRDTGNADALAAAESSEAIRMPMLFAVVALAGVTAGLVRTWVLRRAS
ncbi:hypothetical protein [Saccharomonospora saliphila]|uniref:hypothetical protein n=1 Tax=Saccharomonospora saliphila TaxID=369829 RepID=UPI00036154A1|nr:hypothetical protein [Saccharomonospora saliphila]